MDVHNKRKMQYSMNLSSRRMCIQYSFVNEGQSAKYDVPSQAKPTAGWDAKSNHLNIIQDRMGGANKGDEIKMNSNKNYYFLLFLK